MCWCVTEKYNRLFRSKQIDKTKSKIEELTRKLENKLLNKSAKAETPNFLDFEDQNKNQDFEELK